MPFLMTLTYCKSVSAALKALSCGPTEPLLTAASTTGQFAHGGLSLSKSREGCCHMKKQLYHLHQNISTLVAHIIV